MIAIDLEDAIFPASDAFARDLRIRRPQVRKCDGRRPRRGDNLCEKSDDCRPRKGDVPREKCDDCRPRKGDYLRE